MAEQEAIAARTSGKLAIMADNNRRRAAAREIGASTYIAANSCVSCGTAERRVSSRNCVECKRRRDQEANRINAVEHRARVKDWKARNPERVIENRLRWYADNTEKAKRQSRDWIAENRERARENARRWRQTHAEYQREIKRRYYESNRDKARANGSATKAKRHGAYMGPKAPIVAFCKWLLEAPRVPCYWCAAELAPSDRQIDHIIPLKLGGPHSVGNLCIACAACNNSKGSKLPEDFAGQSELRLA